MAGSTSDSSSPEEYKPPEYKPEDELKDLVKIVTAMKKLKQSGRRWLRDFLAEEFPNDEKVEP
jgi:hypothetical protein